MDGSHSDYSADPGVVQNRNTVSVISPCSLESINRFVIMGSSNTVTQVACAVFHVDTRVPFEEL